MFEPSIKMRFTSTSGVEGIQDAIREETRRLMEVRCAHCGFPKAVRNVKGIFEPCCDSCWRKSIHEVNENGIRMAFPNRFAFLLHKVKQALGKGVQKIWKS